MRFGLKVFLSVRQYPEAHRAPNFRDAETSRSVRSDREGFFIVPRMPKIRAPSAHRNHLPHGHNPDFPKRPTFDFPCKSTTRRSRLCLILNPVQMGGDIHCDWLSSLLCALPLLLGWEDTPRNIASASFVVRQPSRPLAHMIS